MSYGWPLPGQARLWGSYCDDLALVSLIHARLSGPLSPSSVLAEGRASLSAVKGRYGQVGLTLKQEKEKVEQSEATVWGANVSSARREVRGDLTKMKALVFLTVRLVRARHVSTHMMQRVVGYWVHNCLYQRSALCIFQECYRWMELGAQQPHQLRVLPAHVRQELQGFVCLFPLLRSDLSSCLCPTLYATDATEEIGAVVSADLSLADAVLAWTRRTQHLSPIISVMEAHDLYRLQREERRDGVWEQLIAKQRFRLITKYRFRSSAHINVKELLAARTALRHLVSSPSLWHTRAMIAIDSQVVVHCLKKGRSSSRAINQILQTMLGDSLSTGARLVPVWVATECNPADAPTRRRRIPAPVSPEEAYFARRARALESEPWTLALNQHEWGERFDQTLGFPGEGPRSPAQKLILGPVREKETLKDLRVMVQPATIKRYRAKYDLWKAWLLQEHLGSVEGILQSHAIDSVMAAFVQHLYIKDYPLSYGLESLAALQMFHPQVVGKLPRSWRMMREWKRCQPLSIRAPMPLSVLLAMATAAWVSGWQRTACLLLLSFDALLRPGEAASGLRSHLVLPGDLAGQPDSALFTIPDSKTASRTVQIQSVIIFDRLLIALLQLVFGSDKERTPLMPGGLPQFTRRFYQLKHMLNINDAPWGPSSLRGGGAVEYARSTLNIPYLQWKGRWSNPRTMVHYLQTSLGAQSYAKVGKYEQERIMALARLAPTILSPPL
eukprot:6477411-Amphidinium_carterae.1